MTDSFLGGRRIVFLGTPEPAAEILERLISEGFDISLVVTGVDAKRGRGGGLSPSPVKQVALEAGIPVSHDVTDLIENGVDTVGVVVAFGRIIPRSVLDRVPMVNVHFSLLPRWRGAAPVERAILAGDEVTGVCIMDVVDELDAGGVRARREMPIDGATRADLMRTLTGIGSDLLVDVLRGPRTEAHPQVGEPVYAHKIRREESLVDWSSDSVSISRVVRALRAHTSIGGRRLLILDAEPAGASRTDVPGTCHDDAVVDCGDGSLRLLTVKPEGKPPVGATQWRRGVHGAVRLGENP
ncbi:MAG: methionyl-tRNA formyltransferase [Ilumatobacteraceae bacterium]